MAEKVLVIGSNSFSGASFAAWLLEQGANLEVINRFMTGERTPLGYQREPTKFASLYVSFIEKRPPGWRTRGYSLPVQPSSITV